MLAPFKVLLLTLGIVVVFLFSTGILVIKKDGYACAGGWVTGFQDPVEIFHYGFLRINAVPFKRECPDGRRYDPDNVQACVNTGFCTLPETSDPSGL